MNIERDVTRTIDVNGEVCPFPWVHAKKALDKLQVGQVLRIIGDHGPALKNIPQNFGDEGQTVLKAEASDSINWEILVRKER